MTSLGKNWTGLNAYVDGELSPDDAAEVARSIARDPEAASAAAALASLKSSLLDQAEAPEDFDLLPPTRTSKRTGALQAGHMVAAAAVLVACVAVAALYQWNWKGTATNDLAWHEQAADIHRVWATATLDERPPSLTIPALGALSVGEVRVPDLSDSGLTPILLEPVSGLGGLEGYRIGYGGSRGCRLSLFVLQGEGRIPAELSALRSGGLQVLGWRHNSARYLLLADGMAEARFSLIARTLKALTANWQPLSPQIRTALQSNRQQSAPCLA